MSYYTFFYPKKEYYDIPGATLENRISSIKMSIRRYKTIIKASMIDAYYASNTNDAYNTIAFLLHAYYEGIINKEELEWKKAAKDDEKHEIAFNHLSSANSEYEVDDEIERDKEWLQNTIDEMVVLSRIKYAPSNKDDNSYYDDEDFKNEMEWLMGDYSNKVNEMLDTINDVAEDIAKYTFIKDNYSTMKTESELYDEEVKNENDGNAIEDDKENKKDSKEPINVD